MLNIIKYPFTNSVVFAMVMEDPELCRELIARIFPQRRVEEVRIREKPDVVTEATLMAGIRAKHIRLDVRFEDGSSWYDVELQAASEEALPKRSRYYASAGDVKMLHRGEEYRDLKPSFVIFICCFDFFGADEPVYEFQRFDRKLDLPLGDESYIMILNSRCSEKKVPENLRSLFRYINESKVTPGDSFVEKVHERVAALQESEEVRNIMTLEEEFRIRINRAEKAAEETKKAAEETKKAAEETKKAAEETEKAAEETKKAAEEKMKAAAETMKAAEEKMKAAEEATEKAARKSEERLNELNARLLDEERLEDLKRAIKDSAFREQLFEEYKL